MITRVCRSPQRQSHLGDLEEDAGAQFLRGGLAAAGALDQGLQDDVEVVLRQAGPALVQMLADLAHGGRVEFVVEVLVDAVEHLAAVGLVRVPAAHFAPPSGVAPASPRPRAYSSRSARSWRRPRCRRDITVPMGVPMMS